MGFFKHISSLIGFTQLPREHRRVVFYSEGPGYWTHLGQLLQQFLQQSDTSVCFFSSRANDPGLSLKHPNLKSFLIDESWARDWLFANIDTDVMVMTTPDLHQYQLKRSKHDVHYVYVQHSLVSLHMAYRPGAFNHFDTLFCAGPHHVAEAKALQAQNNTRIRHIVAHGYERLDRILSEQENQPVQPEPNSVPHVLIAPSWGETGLIERLGDGPVAALLSAGLHVTLRPHPQTILHRKHAVDEILNKHRDNPLFQYDDDVSSTESLRLSDVMLSDWSGAALDYAFGLGKPVVFVDTPRKVNNKNYTTLGIEPFESSIRSVVGEIVAEDDLAGLGEVVTRLLRRSDGVDRRKMAGEHVFNVGNSASAGANALQQILQECSA